MEAYQIIVTPDAEADLQELRYYITEVLAAPDTALRYLQTVHKEIAGLAVLPERVAPVLEEPWRSRGIRRVLVKNFYVYFRIDESTNRIYILNVIYGRRDQLQALRRMKNSGPEGDG